MARYYRNEKEMYPLVGSWFESALKARLKKHEISVYDTSKEYLHNFLRNKGLDHCFPDVLTYEIKVDLTATIQKDGSCQLGFVECKLNRITLRDVSQLLGYSRVAKPIYSIILSPSGVSSAITRLVRLHNRFDVLNYSGTRRIKIAHWNHVRKEIEASTLLPPGEHL